MHASQGRCPRTLVVRGGRIRTVLREVVTRGFTGSPWLQPRFAVELFYSLIWQHMDCVAPVVFILSTLPLCPCNDVGY